jgi:hypothetical protein
MAMSNHTLMCHCPACGTIMRLVRAAPNLQNPNMMSHFYICPGCKEMMELALEAMPGRSTGGVESDAR